MSMLNIVTKEFFLADAAAGGASMFSSFGILIIMLLFMYFFMIRPQKKKQKEIEKMRSELVVGNRIITIGGFIGKIKKITDDEIYLSLGNSKDTVIVRKWAIQGVLDKDQAKAIESQTKKISSDDSVDFNDEPIDEPIEENNIDKSHDEKNNIND